MADATDDLYLFGDDFEAILGILEADEDLEQHFEAAVSNAQSTDIICVDCGKKYKSKGGYQRHRNSKHSSQQQSPLTPSILAEIVHNAVQKVKDAKVFSTSLQNEFKVYNYAQLAEGTEEFSVMKDLYDGYSKSGNTEKFYGNYYVQVPLKSTRFFQGLSRNAATLLSTKVADSMLAHCKHTKSSSENTVSSTNAALSEKENAGLQYLGGYVLHNLHKKCARRNTNESQQAMAILKAGKLEGSCESQKLVASLSRGGLWGISEHAQKIFTRTEHYFRQLASTIAVGSLQRVDITGIVLKSVSDSELISSFQTMVSGADLVPSGHISKDVLHSIVNLYIRVRTFSLAKDIVQQHKMKAKQTKGKALRKEINRSCDKQPQERQN